MHSFGEEEKPGVSLSAVCFTDFNRCRIVLYYIDI